MHSRVATLLSHWFAKYWTHAAHFFMSFKFTGMQLTNHGWTSLWIQSLVLTHLFRLELRTYVRGLRVYVQQWACYCIFRCGLCMVWFGPTTKRRNVNCVWSFCPCVGFSSRWLFHSPIPRYFAFSVCRGLCISLPVCSTVDCMCFVVFVVDNNVAHIQYTCSLLTQRMQMCVRFFFFILHRNVILSQCYFVLV